MVRVSTIESFADRVRKSDRKKVRPSPVKCPSMSSDYRNKQYQDGNKMCEKSSACDRIRDKTDSNIKVCRFVTQQDLANQTLWWRSHRIQKGTCTWKNKGYDRIRDLHLEIWSIIEGDFLGHSLHDTKTWFCCDWVKKNGNVAVFNEGFGPITYGSFLEYELHGDMKLQLRTWPIKRL